MAAIWYHLIFGLRHLIWDSGRMLGVDASETYAMAGIIAALLLTVFTIIIV